MKKLWMLATVVVVLAGSLLTGNAVVIEGTTPTGKFKTVGLDDYGNFRVAIGTGATNHVIVDNAVYVQPSTGAVFSVQGAGGAPLEVTNSTSAPLTVSVAGNFIVAASTISTTVNNQFAVTVGAAICYPVDPARKQGVICNASDTINIYIGDAGVTISNGAILGPGSCYSPDVPSSYIGSLTCVSTAPASGFYIYGK